LVFDARQIPPRHAEACNTLKEPAGGLWGILNKICEVMEKIWLKKEENWDLNRLEHEIALAANQIKRFEESCIHCGYHWN